MSADKCPVCRGSGFVHRRGLTGPNMHLWTVIACPGCTYRPPLSVLAAQEAELHDGDCCDPKDAA